MEGKLSINGVVIPGATVVFETEKEVEEKEYDFREHAIQFLKSIDAKALEALALQGADYGVNPTEAMLQTLIALLEGDL